MPVIAYQTEERDGVLRGYAPRPGPVRIRLVTFDRPQRLRRAGLGLATWWSVALASVFLPVAHLVLVPGFAVFGVWSFVQRSRTAVVAVFARGTCPDCDTEQEFDLPGRWTPEVTVHCRSCHRSLRLTTG